MKRLLWCSALAAVIQLTGCATADLTAFSDQTTSLTDTLIGEHQLIAEKMNEVVTLSELGAAEGWFAKPVFASEDGSAERAVRTLADNFDPEEKQETRRAFLDRAEALRRTYDAIRGYSTSLAELAAAGETGDAAVQRSVGTLNGLVSTLGGPATFVGASAAQAVGEIGDLVTQAQAQSRVEDAMSILAGPEGALRKTVDLLLQELDALERSFVLPLYDQVTLLEQYHHGPGLISFYNNSNSWMYRNRAFYLMRMDDEARAEFLQDATEQELYEALIACLGSQPSCPQASLAAGLASRLILISDIEEQFRSYEAAIRRNTQWRNARVQAIALAKDALVAWADQHDAIYGSLQSCGGFKALKPGCGNWSEANLESAVVRLQNILPDTSPAD